MRLSRLSGIATRSHCSMWQPVGCGRLQQRTRCALALSSLMMSAVIQRIMRGVHLPHSRAYLVKGIARDCTVGDSL